MRTIQLLLILLLPASLFATSFKVVDIKGSPFYRPEGSLKKVAIQKGKDLSAGARIKMKDGDQLSLKTPMGDSIELSGKTYMKLSDLDTTKGKTKVSLELFNGISTNKVAKLGAESSFTIRTPSAVAGVRGTEFQVAVSDTGETEVDVMEGEVGVADAEGNADPIPVTAGKSAKVKKGGGISVKVVKNIKKRASRRAAKAAKVKETKAASGGKSGGESSSGGDGTSGDSEGESEGESEGGSEGESEGDSTEEGADGETSTDVTTDDGSTEVEVDVSTDEVVDTASEEAQAVVEEAVAESQAAVEEATELIQEEITNEEIADAVEEANAAVESISVDLESINR